MDFWDNHGIFFIIFLFFFPRLTMFFAAVWGGFLWWIGWIFAPRLLVAILATNSYWNTNKIIVVLTWIWALGGESCEKGGIKILGSRKK